MYVYDISFSEQVIAGVLIPTESPYNVNNTVCILVTNFIFLIICISPSTN